MAVPNEELVLTPDKLQVDIVGREVVEILPLQPDLTGPINFRINSRIDKHYIDISNINMELTLALVKADGTAATYADTKASFVNNIAHSIFKNVEVKLNQKVCTDGDQNYHFLAYMSKLLNYSPEVFRTQGAMFGWAKDVAGDMDAHDIVRAAGVVTTSVQADLSGTVTVVKTLPKDENPLSQRNGWFFDNMEVTKGTAVTTYKDVTFFDKLMVAPFMVDKLLPYGIDIFITLQQASQEFFMMVDNANKGEKLLIKDIKLHVPYVKLNDPTFLQMETTMKLGKSRRIPMVRKRVIRYPIASGTVHPRIQHLFSGRSLPQKIVVGIVENAAEAGDFEMNPYNFDYNKVQSVQIFKNGMAYPKFPYQPDFAKKKYIKEFASVFDVSNTRNVNVGFPIEYDEYPQGFCLYGFDLTGDHKTEEDTAHIKEYGDITFDIVFKTAPAKAVTLVVFAEYEEQIILDEFNNVRLSWDG